ncbi:hypothetical protein [Acuticoccus sp.]|uniref:hypothetical protein n=1 Tax=Acuticoccus sp. TaxID=1904378 RepID=UPI003B5192B9
MRRATLVLTLVVAAAVGTVPRAGAFEATGNAVADGFLAVVQSGGYMDVAATDVARQDGATVLTGVSATSEDRAERLTIGTVEINGGVIDADNRLIADRIAYGDVRITNRGGQEADSTATLITVTNARLPLREGDGSWLATVLGGFERVEVDGLVARPPVGGPVSVQHVEVASAPADGGEVTSGRIALEGVEFDVAFLQGAATQFLRDVGYERMTIDALLDGRWDRAGGAAAIRDLTLSADGLGAVTLEATMDGVTAATITALSDGGGDVGRLLSLLQTVSVSALTVRYDDDGLAQRLIDRAAVQRGVDGQEVIAGTVQALRSALAVVGDPAFTEEVASALSAFLADPGTLTLSAAPPSEVSVAQLFGGAVMQPRSLPALLNVTVTATP